MPRPSLSSDNWASRWDGRIALPSGESKYINGASGLDHIHRIRATVDAVLVGVGTVIADDPQLNVRRVPGRDPARVVLDPNGRLPASARCLQNDGARRLVSAAPRRRARCRTGSRGGSRGDGGT